MKNKNKQALLPKVRFPEFKTDGAWDAMPLGNVSDRIVEKVGEAKLTTVSITAGRGFVSQAEKFGRDISGAQYKNYIFLRHGEFSYNKGNSNLYPQGCVYRLKEFDQAAASNAFICFRLHQGQAPGFYEGFFGKNAHGRQLIRFLTSGARSDGLLNISPEEFFSVRVPLPPRPSEQQKIADCLSSLDELIAAEGRKLEALRAHKKGLMQQLFPRAGETRPRHRFPEFRNAPEWEEATVGSRCESFSGGTPDTTRKEYYGGRIPFIRSAEIGKDSTELFLTEQGLENSAAKLVERGEVLVALYGANSGDVALSRLAGAINQAILCLRPEGNRAFLYHYLTEKKAWILATYIQGGQGNLSGEIVKSISLWFPLPKEQEAVADCLSAVDDLIAEQNRKTDALQTHKKGLMQQLFPSPEEVEA